MTQADDRTPWPALPYADWADTCAALHLWSQIVGKYRLAHTPWVNHSWHATLYVTPRGLTTGPVHEGGGCVSLSFDFVDHRLIAEADGGAQDTFPLEAMRVADFFNRTENGGRGRRRHLRHRRPAQRTARRRALRRGHRRPSL